MGEVILKLFVFTQQPQIFLGPAEMKLDAALNHSLPGDVAPVTHDAGEYLHACLNGSVNPSLHHYDAAVGCSRTGRGGAFPRVLTICVIVLTYSLSTINVLSWLHGAVMKLGEAPRRRRRSGLGLSPRLRGEERCRSVDADRSQRILTRPNHHL